MKKTSLLLAFLLFAVITAFAVPIGKTVSMTVSSDGTAPFTYQWYKDGVAIPGATADKYVIPNFAQEHGGLYHVVVSNEAGSVASNKVTLAPVRAPTKSTITVNIAVGSVNP